jgi:hypothetical protein
MPPSFSSNIWIPNRCLVDLVGRSSPLPVSEISSGTGSNQAAFRSFLHPPDESMKLTAAGASKQQALRA